MKNYLLSLLVLFFISTLLCQAQKPILWGLTSSGGTNGEGVIFYYNSATGTETVLHNFGSDTDGQNPYGSLIQAKNGLLYGTTYEGGVTDSGIIFSFNISTGTEKVLHSFGKGTDGKNPFRSLIQASNGLLYGMTFGGGADTNVYGASSGGIIFRYSISTGTETDMHDFDYGTDGYNPVGSLIQVNDSLLYGMTSTGGVNGWYGGIIFSYNIHTGSEIDLHDFGGQISGKTDGFWPQDDLIKVNDSLLYGMTWEGGANNEGIIFSYNISTGNYNDIHDFGSDNDGVYPFGSLIQVGDSLLYGMTFNGGITGAGIIFSDNIFTHNYTDIHDFGSGLDGEEPASSLIQASNGVLYGTTTGGGSYAFGTMFSYNISADSETIIYDFTNGLDGNNPFGNVAEIDSPVTGINQFPVSSYQLLVFPNPSFNIIHTSIELKQTSDLQLRLVNMLGQTLWSADAGNVSSYQKNISVSDLPDGVYLLEVITRSGTESKEVVVTK